MGNGELSVRWTIGDVSDLGFEALRLSLWGMWGLLGKSAIYTVCVNTISVPAAKERTGPVPADVKWHESTIDQIPSFIREKLDHALAQGVGWKFAPLRIHPDRNELSLDNDCIIWSMPMALAQWMHSDDYQRCLFAEDVVASFGQFTPFCSNLPRNSGIRGIPAGFDLEGILKILVDKVDFPLGSELDEQGLQYAAVSFHREPLVVSVNEVSICSPFPPHLPHEGTCGVHCVGLNVRISPWDLDGRPATEHIRENWLKVKTRIAPKLKAYNQI